MEKRPVASHNTRKHRGSQSWSRGVRAETLAALWLRAKGYRILARRWRCAAGEIDLVAWRRGTLIAVEVKARPDYAAGLEAIRPAQQSRLNAALVLFAAQHPKFAATAMRLDAVVICPRRLPQHLADAWRA